jgi:hypothetical protein
MTIPLLEVSFNRIFEYGQAYVALSRATCLSGLTLLSFSSNAVKAHPKVVAFYEELKKLKRTQNNNLSVSTKVTQVDNGGTMIEDEEIFDVHIGDLVRQYQCLTSTKPDDNQWLESRNKPSSNYSSGFKTGIADENYGQDEWLERKGPSRSISSTKETNKELTKISKESVVVTQYEPSQSSTDVIDLSADFYVVSTPGIYGEVSKHNNTSIESLNIGEDLKRLENLVYYVSFCDFIVRKIEENRQAALKKLELAR